MLLTKTAFLRTEICVGTDPAVRDPHLLAAGLHGLTLSLLTDSGVKC